MRALRSESHTAGRRNAGDVGHKDDRGTGRWGAAWGRRARATEVSEAAGRGGGGPLAALRECLGDAERMREETEDKERRKNKKK